VSDKIELIKRLNITFIFTANNHQSIIDAQILSSLGIHSGITLPAETCNWDNLTNLITYTFYGIMPHSAIEPFATMEKYYCGTNYVSPLFAEFENPDRYIHVDAEGNLIALVSKGVLGSVEEDTTNKQLFVTFGLNPTYYPDESDENATTESVIGTNGIIMSLRNDRRNEKDEYIN
jgi:hypothetical protein